MKVLLVNKFHYHKGGSETYYFTLADGLRKLGHEVFFFSMQDERNEPCDQSDYFVMTRDYNGSSSLIQKASSAVSFVYSREAKRKFETLCEKVHPDIVHLNLVHRQITLSILDAPYLKKHRVPVVYTAHDYILVCPDYLLLDGKGRVCDECLTGHYASCIKNRCVKGSLAKSSLAAIEAEFLKITRAYGKIDCFIAPSEFMRSKLVEGGLPSQKIVVMRNPMMPIAVDERGNDQSNVAPYFLFFGRLTQEKGALVLLRAFALAMSEIPGEWRLKIAGEGPLRKQLEQECAALGIGDRVDILGFRSGEELYRLVQGARFAVVPSVWVENMPYSVGESLALGTPVIGSDIGSLPEFVSEGNNGFLFNVGDSQDLAFKLVEASRVVGEQYRRLSLNGRELIKETCSQPDYLHALVNLYSHLIAEKKGQ